MRVIFLIITTFFFNVVSLYNLIISKVADSLDSIDEFLKTCEPADQKDLYMQLIKGVDSLYQKICTDGNFRMGTFFIFILLF